MFKQIFKVNTLAFIVFTVFNSALYPMAVVAGGPVQIESSIVNLKAKQGETARTSIKILNNSPSRWTVFGFDKELNSPDKTIANDRSLIRWLQYNHAQEISPATTTSLDLAVSVFPFAKPGFYYADITFVPEVNRNEAEKRINLTGKTIRLNFEVLDDANEEITLTEFRSEKQFNFEPPTIFMTEIMNSGNRALSLEGVVRVSDRSGKEVGIVNLQSTDLDVGESKTIQASFQGLIPMGKYKAYLALRYGTNNRLVQDSTFFWMFDLKKILSVFIIGLLISLIVGHFLHSFTARLRS